MKQCRAYFPPAEASVEPARDVFSALAKCGSLDSLLVSKLRMLLGHQGDEAVRAGKQSLNLRVDTDAE